ncbi:MAG: type II toxin-antitoxin system RelE/ParE family toxin [Methylococcaceae bacterium]
MKSILTTEKFDKWFENLRDLKAKARIEARIQRAKSGNFGDCKPIGEGLSEMRIDYGAGYRVYFMQRGAELVILLGGGDKTTQSTDIQNVLQLSHELKRG